MQPLGRQDQLRVALRVGEHRFGLVNRLPVTIEWLSDNGSCYVAGETRSFARDIGLEPRTTPIESPLAVRAHVCCKYMRAGIDPNFRELTAVDETGVLIGPWNPWAQIPEIWLGRVKALSKLSTLIGYSSWMGAASC
jgi:hypothetical protein